MTWKIEFEANAKKALNKLPLVAQRRIVRALDDLALDPYASPHVKALQGREGYRLRVGDYRVVYNLEKGRLVIRIVRVAQRGAAY